MNFTKLIQSIAIICIAAILLTLSFMQVGTMIEDYEMSIYSQGFEEGHQIAVENLHREVCSTPDAIFDKSEMFFQLEEMSTESLPYCSESYSGL